MKEKFTTFLFLTHYFCKNQHLLNRYRDRRQKTHFWVLQKLFLFPTFVIKIRKYGKKILQEPYLCTSRRTAVH